jgi:hypothetical protein
MTTSAPCRELQRMSRGASWDEASRSAQVILSSDADVGDGVILPHTREAIEWPNRPLPLVVDHGRTIDRVAGAVTQLQLERIDGRQALVGRIELDGPAAELVEPLLRTGAARFSVAARVLQLEPGRRGGPDVATRWAPVELSAVVVGQDPAAVLRSNNNQALEGAMTTTTAAPAASTVTITESPELQRSAKEVRRERDILRAAQAAGLDTEQTEELIRNGKPINEVHVAIYEILRDRLSPAPAGHPCRMPSMDQESSETADLLTAALEGEVQADLPTIARGMLHINESTNSKVLNRAFSTSDFVQSLTSSVERVLLNGYEEPVEGVRSLALARILRDFREIKMLRLTQFGGVQLVEEGGEYKANTYSEEEAASLQAAQYGAIAVLSRVAQANDNLDIFGRLLTEMGRAAARKEAAELALRLGDITWDATNSLSSQTALDVESVGAAVLLLRRQADADGNKISFSPDLLVIAPEEETTARQMLGNYQPNTAGEVNPFSTLRLEVDHNLTGGTAYLADTRYQPLGIGRVGNGPSLAQEEDFKTGNISFRVQHDFGTTAIDGRSIVKIAL